jgi:hypothetical protein
MVAPAIIAAGIGAGASLLGGLFGRSERRKDAYANSPAGIRENAQRAGFNPLAFIGVPQGAGYAPTFGNSIANAGAAIANGITENEQLKLQKTALDQENERLRLLAEENVLRPKVPGLYGSPLPVPRGGFAPRAIKGVGASTASAVKAAPAAVGAPMKSPTLGDTFAPGFQQVDMPFSTAPGVTSLRNWFTGGQAVLVPGSDGEPMGIDELATAAVFGLPQMAFGSFNRALDGLKKSPPVDYSPQGMKDEKKREADRLADIAERRAKNQADAARRESDFQYDKFMRKLPLRSLSNSRPR